MLRALIEKEWKSVLLSPKFALTFAVCSILILLSIVVGVREYKAFEEQQASAGRLLSEELQEKTNWMGLSTRAFRESDPMQIFVSGVHNDIGRLAQVSPSSDARLDQSIYSDDSILAVFRSFDLTFIVQAVLSLFAILFTYDAINGEREAGTLKLIFSGAVPRARFVLAKFVGTWLGLAVPLSLPVLLGLLVVVLAKVPMDMSHWTRLGLFLLASALYFTVFMALGIAVSALTRHPSTSFLILLVTWVMLVLVVPRASLMAAVQLRPVSSVAEIESQKAGYQARAWNDYRRELEKTWRNRQAEMNGLSEEDQEAYEDEKMWDWMEVDDQSRKDLQRSISDHSMKLDESLRNQKRDQERLAFSLSRISPASAFQLAAMNLAGTNVALKERYEDAARGYRTSFTNYIDEKSGGHEMVSVRRGGRGGAMSFGGEADSLELDDMPQFEAPRLTVSQAAASAPLDLGILAIESMLCFAFGFVGFLRYDVR